MPRPKRPTRARKIAVSDLEWAFLNDAIDIDGDPALYGGTGMRLWELTYNFALGGTRHPTTDLWEEYDTVIVEQWAIDKPGTRPSCWWSFSAPRGELQSFWNDFNLPESRLFAEPRRRLGGTGTPLHEVMAFAPSFSFGIPTRWPEAEHLDGTVASGSCINGVPVCRVYAGRGPKVVLVDPKDPPIYESEASYLVRHGLLLPGERERLTDEDFEPEAVAFEDCRDPCGS